MINIDMFFIITTILTVILFLLSSYILISNTSTQCSENTNRANEMKELTKKMVTIMELCVPIAMSIMFIAGLPRVQNAVQIQPMDCASASD